MTINITDRTALYLFIFSTMCLLVLFVGEPDVLDAIRNAIYPDKEYFEAHPKKQ